jgi:acyl carrier protein
VFAPPPAQAPAAEPVPAPLPAGAPLLSGRDDLVRRLRAIIEETSGLSLADVPDSMSFLDAGLDSLVLAQLAQILQKRFAVGLTFRHLLEKTPCLGVLADYLDAETGRARPTVEAK